MIQNILEILPPKKFKMSNPCKFQISLTIFLTKKTTKKKTIGDMNFLIFRFFSTGRYNPLAKTNSQSTTISETEKKVRHCSET